MFSVPIANARRVITAFKYIRKKLGNKNPKVVLLSLTVRAL